MSVLVPVWLLANPALATGNSRALTLAQQEPSRGWSVVLEGGPGNLSAPPGVTLHQLAPQCVCCAGQLVLRVTLARILRLEKPQRLLLELAHGEHLDQVQSMLQSGSFSAFLRLEPVPHI